MFLNKTKNCCYTYHQGMGETLDQTLHQYLPPSVNRTHILVYTSAYMQTEHIHLYTLQPTCKQNTYTCIHFSLCANRTHTLVYTSAYMQTEHIHLYTLQPTYKQNTYTCIHFSLRVNRTHTLVYTSAYV